MANLKKKTRLVRLDEDQIRLIETMSMNIMADIEKTPLMNKTVAIAIVDGKIYHTAMSIVLGLKLPIVNSNN